MRWGIKIIGISRSMDKNFTIVNVADPEIIVSGGTQFAQGFRWTHNCWKVKNFLSTKWIVDLENICHVNHSV